MGNELPTTCAKKKIRKYLKKTHKKTHPTIVLDLNSCWIDTNVPFLKILRIKKKKIVLSQTIQSIFQQFDLSPNSQSSPENVFLSWFRETKRLDHQPSKQKFHYKLKNGECGCAECELKFLEINSIKISEIIVTDLKLQKKDNFKNDILTNQEQLSIKKNTKLSKISSAPLILGKGNPFSDNEINNKNKRRNVLRLSSQQSVTGKSSLNVLSFNNKSTRKRLTKINKESIPAGNHTDLETNTINIKRGDNNNNNTLKKENGEKSAVEVLDVHKIEILKIIEGSQCPETILDKNTEMINHIIEIHKKGYSSKCEEIKFLSGELFDFRKSNRNNLEILESRMYRLINQIQKEKNLKRGALDLNRKLKRNLFELKKIVQKYQKIYQDLNNPNIKEFHSFVETLSNKIMIY
ncbi:hypothetical protein M0812_11948 [Anaeramoeba flamelloides]|uniref:Uncharacterized protein n=1 Tax=Anaeramoeba flamelloides TaxID=1746091 RepID=A0AAV7ZNY9_9EUKA|nr:hypothetical protein M0812_11948 [Anaeramoeba flamelloides]